MGLNDVRIPHSIRDEMKKLGKAMSGDLSFSVSALGSVAAAATATSFDVRINLVDSNSALHDWIDNFQIAASATTTSASSNNVTVSDATPDLSNGTVKITVSMATNGGAIQADDTVTVTVSAATVLGYVVSAATTQLTVA